MFLLDTDHVGIIQRMTEPEFNRLSTRMSRHLVSAFFVPIISFQEQLLGWNAFINRARTKESIVRGYQKLQGILADFSVAQVVPFDEAASSRFEYLRQQRIRIGTMDQRIAAIALSRDLTLLSRNLGDFRKVPGLKVEDWTL